ncbi:unannotated protein [freshwater metagenome]|uniref:Unannotated protein n=1 Tax=freshwater metagenome TaxID=449393 RepID=A0A6J7W4W5_9ZZZZ
MKSALKGFGPIYVTNVKSRTDRRDHMLAEFKKQVVTDFEFFECIDAATQDLSAFVGNIEALAVSKQELAASISHLKLIENWLATSASPYAIIMEDDLTFETVDDWQWDWREFLDKIEPDYQMLQLAIINPGRVNTSIHYREARDWSVGCYLIKRSWAETLMKKYFKNGKIIFPDTTRVRTVPEGVIYSGALCLSFPLFVNSISLGPNINEDKIETMHKKSRDEVLEFWKTKPKSLTRKLPN